MIQYTSQNALCSDLSLQTSENHKSAAIFIGYLSQPRHYVNHYLRGQVGLNSYSKVKNTYIQLNSQEKKVTYTY